MGTSGYLATVLDIEMLIRNGASIYQSDVHDEAMPVLSAAELAHQLGERPLLRYLLHTQLREFLSGTTVPQYLTPSAYSSEETVGFLALPAPEAPRPYVLLLDPRHLSDVRGPRRIKFGLGVEYIALSGFPGEAIVDMSSDSRSSPARWPLQVR